MSADASRSDIPQRAELPAAYKSAGCGAARDLAGRQPASSMSTGALSLRERDEQDEISAAMRLAVKTATRRSWHRLAKERIENIKPAIPLGKKFWPLAAEEHSEITHLSEKEHVRQLAATLRSRKDNAPVDMLDAPVRPGSTARA
jgi:hypothetical protein